MRQKIERKAVLLQVFFVLAVVICPWDALAAFGTISSVDIIPLQPTDTDIITFDISGMAMGNPSWVEYDQFSQDGTSLWLDLYIDTGVYASSSNWTYERQITTLPANTYTLEVRAFDYSDDTLDDTYTVGFTVVPEPMTLAFLGVGLCILRTVSKSKNKEADRP